MAVAEENFSFIPLPTHYLSFENSPPPWVFFVVPLPERIFLPPCWNFVGAHVWVGTWLDFARLYIWQLFFFLFRPILDCLIFGRT